jgi:hypothetical protein
LRKIIFHLFYIFKITFTSLSNHFLADAGDNITIALPQTETVLNGSRSKDDFKIVSYQWEEVEGPNNVVFTSANSSVTNVTKLTKGEYTFKLTVVDDNGNKDFDTIILKVTQSKI